MLFLLRDAARRTYPRKRSLEQLRGRSPGVGHAPTRPQQPLTEQPGKDSRTMGILPGRPGSPGIRRRAVSFLWTIWFLPFTVPVLPAGGL
jgi:hypothetical protein